MSVQVCGIMSVQVCGYKSLFCQLKNYRLMNIFIPHRHFDPSVPEMIDNQNNDPLILRDDLKNLQVINRLFGGLAAVLSEIKKLLLRMDKHEEISILDLATGSADHPVAIANFLYEKELNFKIVAVDKNPDILEVARQQSKDFPEIHIEEHDILKLPYGSDSFDIVICSLAIHHFTEDEVIIILNHMNLISRVALIVNDLNRTWPGAWTTWLYTHATTRNPMTLHDSYLSVLRGFTKSELGKMAVKAGIEKITIKKRPFFRLLLIGE